MQLSPDAQAFAHLPQFFASVVTSMHLLEQHMPAQCAPQVFVPVPMSAVPPGGWPLPAGSGIDETAAEKIQ